MMIKFIQRVLFLLALVVLLGSTIVQAESIQPRFSHISRCSVGLDISGGIAEVIGGGAGCYTDTYSTAAVCLMCRPLTGGAWESFDMWRAYGKGQAFTCVDAVVPVEYGYQYKVYLCFYVSDADGNILESFGAYSDVMSYP